MSLLGLSRGKVTYLRGFILGSSLVYGLLVLKGYAPLWFGPENPRWSKKQWSKSAQSCMEELENNKDYSCYKIQPSTRNFITVHESTEERRIRYVYYFSRKFKRLIGIIHFGADCEGPPRYSLIKEIQLLSIMSFRSVHGGCSAAIIDAACGVCAILSSVTPHVTANLNVNYRAKIPLVTTLQ